MFGPHPHPAGLGERPARHHDLLHSQVGGRHDAMMARSQFRRNAATDEASSAKALAMKTIHYEIEIVDDNCTGCYYCERACPTGAITMTGPRKSALAVVDNDRCIACTRCIDVCDDDAMLLVERAEPITVGFDTTAIDPIAVAELCLAAAMELKQVVCFCSATAAAEVAAAILAGHDTFEDLALVTGVQSGCLMYCSVTMRRLLLAHSGQAPSGSKVRRYDCEQGLLDIPPELARTYPRFGIEEEQRYLSDRLATLRARLSSEEAQ